MATLTFEAITATVAAFHAREAASREPAAVAHQALDTLREALIAMPRDERMEVAYLLGQIVSEAIDAAHARDDRSWELTQDLKSLPF